jgi:hypothetical protein
VPLISSQAFCVPLSIIAIARPLLTVSMRQMEDLISWTQGDAPDEPLQHLNCAAKTRVDPATGLRPWVPVFESTLPNAVAFPHCSTPKELAIPPSIVQMSIPPV